MPIPGQSECNFSLSSRKTRSIVLTCNHLTCILFSSSTHTFRVEVPPKGTDLSSQDVAYRVDLQSLNLVR